MCLLRALPLYYVFIENISVGTGVPEELDYFIYTYFHLRPNKKKLSQKICLGMQDVIFIVKCQFQINVNESLWEVIPKNKLTKLGRCGSSTLYC